MGQVMLARDMIANDRPVAIKLLLPEYREQTSDFMREYAVQRRLDHPAIPRVYDFGFGQHAGREVPYFVMDYVRGIPLANALLQLREPAAGFSWVLQTLRGLDHLHRAGYLHRDLKPSNVLVTFDGNPEDSAHLIDFGIAISFDETPEELFIGTPEYSAPELMAGSPFDVRQDLYAAGLLIYELVSGKRPWSGEDPTDLYNKRMYSAYPRLEHTGCPQALSLLVDDLLKPSPLQRPSSAAEVIERFLDATARPPAFDRRAPSANHVVETPSAFRRHLQTVLFEESDTLDKAAASWLGEGVAPYPAVLLIEDPPGFDGGQIVHELTDRAAVAGARVVRYALEPRPHGPLEAIEPVLALLRRLREARGGAAPFLGGLAGAATLLTRLPGPLVIAIEGLGWADTLTLELLATLFTGAKNPGLRVIATIDPKEGAIAERSLQRLRSAPTTRYVERAPLTLEAVTDWVDTAVGADVVPDARILQLWEKSEGRPQRVRELLTEDLRRGVLRRLRTGFAWDGERAKQFAVDAQEGRVRPPSQPMLPAAGALLPLDDLVSTVVEAVPEGVVSTFLGLPSANVRHLVADGVLARTSGGWIMAGPRGPQRTHRDTLSKAALLQLHERLARAIELALPFDGKAERTAREWLRSSDPLRAVPHLLEAAQRAALPRRGDVLPRAAALLDDARKILEAEERNVAQRRGPEDERVGERLRGLKLDLGAARMRLARALGDWPAWQRAATELFERALEAAHLPTMEAALDSLMHLAADRGAEEEMVSHARSLAELSPQARWALTWAEARVQHAEGRPIEAIETIRRFFAGREGETLSSERRLELGALEAEILTTLGWLPEAEVALKLQLEMAARLADRAAGAHAALLSATLLREAHQPDKALAELRRLGVELGDDRFYRLDGRLEVELARAHMEFGWYETAREHLAQGIALALRDGDGETLLLGRLADARALVMLDRAGAALEQLEVAREAASRLPRPALRQLEHSDLEIRFAASDVPLERLLEATRRLAAVVASEGIRNLVVKSHALAARVAMRIGAHDEALASAQTALERAAEWGGVGLPRHQLLFLLARARHARRDGFRAKRILGQAEAQLQQLARSLADPIQRAAIVQEPNNRRIELADLASPGPLSRRIARP
jgi:serine/threonine-protein kinase